MHPSNYPLLVGAFLVIDQPRQRLSHWTRALALLDDGRAPPLAGVTAYYDPTVDQALLGVRYDELALGPDKLAFVVELALLAEIGMIQPAELTEGDRKRFLGERLARCSVHVTDQRNVISALTELVRFLRERKLAAAGATVAQSRTPSTAPRARTTSNHPVARDAVRTPAARGSLVPRGTIREVLLVTPKSTRDDLPPQAKPGAEASRVVDVPVRRIARPSTPNIVRRRETANQISATRVATSKVIANQVVTTTLEASEVRRLAAASFTPAGLTPESFGAGPGHGGMADPYLTTADAGSAGVIHARFLRSGRWVPVRIGALSLKGAALLSGALPRLLDRIELALSFGQHRALVRGPVSKVSSIEETLLSGTATFSVTFELDEGSRRELVALLTAARVSHVTIKPPPARKARRFPVEWPVCLGTARGAVRAEALDVSAAGLFVRPVQALVIDTTVNFSAVIDDGNAPISGRARVVRQVNATEAAACGLAAGYGLRLVEMGPVDAERWAEFLTRVARRSDKRVLVGASPARLAQLQASLSAAGYTVIGGTDPDALAALANGEPRSIDAALIDSTWIEAGLSSTWLETLFSAHSVPCATMQGDVRRARLVIDQLLELS